MFEGNLRTLHSWKYDGFLYFFRNLFRDLRFKTRVTRVMNHFSCVRYPVYAFPGTSKSNGFFKLEASVFLLGPWDIHYHWELIHHVWTNPNVIATITCYISIIYVYIYTRVYIYIHNRQMQVIIIYSVCNCCYHHVPHNISRLCPVNFALHFAPGPSTAGEPPTALSEPAVCHLCHAHNMMENTIAYMIGF